MKTKFKEIVKKIKNWLSSLSKWAQKNKLKLFAFCCLTFLLFGNFMTCSKNKKTASAQTIYSNDKIFMIAPFSFENSLGTELTMMPIYIGYDSENRFSYIDMAYSTDWQNGSFKYSRYGLYKDGLDSLRSEFIEFSVRTLDNTNVWYYERNEDYTSKSYISIAIEESVYNGNLAQYIFDYCVNYNLTIYEDSFMFEFINSNSQVVAIISIDTLSNTYNANAFTMPCIFLSSYTDRVAMSEELLRNSYTDGYNKGYYIGYNEGIGTTFDDIDPMRPFAKGIATLLDTKLFGTFSISELFGISMGCLLFGFAIKMFLGG